MLETKLKNQKRFSVSPGTSILDAALQADIFLPHSCKTGRCGTCKTQILNGTTFALHDEPSLTQQEKKEGWILTCVRAPLESIELDLEDISVKLPEQKMLPSRIQSLKKLTDDVLQVTLRLPPTANFEYLPGQYIDITNNQGIKRSYSISNTFKTSRLIELHIRNVPNGKMSDYWFQAASENDLLRINGPLGTFFVREHTDIDLVFLATGTGIAPIKSILEELASTNGKPRSISLYWGNRKKSDFYWDPKELSLDINYTPVLSKVDLSWDGRNGYIQEVYISSSPNLKNTQVYACGSEKMIHSAEKLLIQSGLQKQNFMADAFVCSATTE